MKFETMTQDHWLVGNLREEMTRYHPAIMFRMQTGLLLPDRSIVAGPGWMLKIRQGFLIPEQENLYWKVAEKLLPSVRLI